MTKLALLITLSIFLFPSPPPLAPPPTPTFTPVPITPSPTPPQPPTPTFTPVIPMPTPTPGAICLSAVEGLVQDANTGVPLQGVVVELKGNGWKTQTATGSDGLFRIHGLCYGVGEISIRGMKVVEGETKVFLDGKSTVRVTLKARILGPVQTPTPTRAQGLPKTGNAWWIVAAGLALGVLAMALNRLRHFVRRSS